jgi:hypothetical protein
LAFKAQFCYLPHQCQQASQNPYQANNNNNNNTDDKTKQKIWPTAFFQTTLFLLLLFSCFYGCDFMRTTTYLPTYLPTH